MNRTGLLIALGIGAAVGLVFAVYPELDLALMKPFRDDSVGGGWVGLQWFPQRVRNSIWWLIAVIAAVPVIAVVVKLMWPWRAMLIPGRAAVLMIATLILGPALVVNGILKEYGGRSRPIDVTQYQGAERFVPWWDPRGQCRRNCSFAAGEPSGAFWTLAPAAVAPLQLRAFAYGGALALGAASGALRMAAGGHFFTDVVFSGVIDFTIIWLMHGLLYRWRATRIADGDVERALERVSMPVYRGLKRVLGRKQSSAPPDSHRTP